MFYNPPLHLGIGLSVLIIGLLLALGAPGTDAQAAKVESLPSLTAAQLASAGLGQEVLLEGRVSPDAPTVHRNFVAYVREEYRQSLLDETSRWIESERVTPPFALQLADGPAAIVNGDYDFPLVEEVFEEAPATTFAGAIRSRGLIPGAPVFVVGVVVEHAGGRGVQASQVYPGARADHVVKARGWASGELQFGLIMSVVGAAQSGLGGWQLRRFLREVRSEQREAEPIQI